MACLTDTELEQIPFKYAQTTTLSHLTVRFNGGKQPLQLQQWVSTARYNSIVIPLSMPMVDASTAKFWLEPVGLANNIGFSAKELWKLQGIVQENQKILLKAWNGYFGDSSGRES